MCVYVCAHACGAYLQRASIFWWKHVQRQQDSWALQKLSGLVSYMVNIGIGICLFFSFGDYLFSLFPFPLPFSTLLSPPLPLLGRVLDGLLNTCLWKATMLTEHMIITYRASATCQTLYISGQKPHSLQSGHWQMVITEGLTVADATVSASLITFRVSSPILCHLAHIHSQQTAPTNPRGSRQDLMELLDQKWEIWWKGHGTAPGSWLQAEIELSQIKQQKNLLTNKIKRKAWNHDQKVGDAQGI